MRCHYTAYGVRITSNRPIPKLITGSASDEPGLEIRFGEKPTGLLNDESSWSVRYQSAFFDEAGQPALTIWETADGHCLVFRYTDSAEYIVARTGDRVWVACPDSMPIQNVLSYLLGPVMGLILRIRGRICLHASSVAINGKAFLFSGPSFAGKSTLAIIFARSGYATLADDVVALRINNDQVMIDPAYPQLRLRPDSLDSISAIFDNVPPLPQPDPGMRLHFDLRQEGHQFQETPLPVGGIYILGERQNSPAAPSITKLAASSGFISLISESYGSRFLDRRMRKEEFEFWSHISASIPMRQVHAHEDIFYLNRLKEMIVEDATR